MTCERSGKGVPTRCEMKTLTAFAIFLFSLLPVRIHGRYTLAETSSTSSKFDVAWHDEQGSWIRCRATSVPIAHQYVSCTEQDKNDTFEKCPLGKFQPEIAASSKFEPLCQDRWKNCNKALDDESVEVFSNCTLENHPCFDDGRCSLKNGFCGTDCRRCHRIPDDCPRDRAKQDCTCATAPTVGILNTPSTPKKVPETSVAGRQEIELPNNTISKSNTSHSSGNDPIARQIEDDEVDKAVYGEDNDIHIELGTEGWVSALIALGCAIVLVWIIVAAIFFWKWISKTDKAQPRMRLPTCSSINDMPRDQFDTHDSDNSSEVQEAARPIGAVIPMRVGSEFGNEEERQVLVSDSLPTENQVRTALSLAPRLNVDSLLNSDNHADV